MKKLFLIGMGPGDESLVTPKAREAIAASTDLVAYGLYLDLLGDQANNKTLHNLPPWGRDQSCAIGIRFGLTTKRCGLNIKWRHWYLCHGYSCI